MDKDDLIDRGIYELGCYVANLESPIGYSDDIDYKHGCMQAQKIKVYCKELRMLKMTKGGT